MKKTNKKGFTIVELVIVIAVIAILAAVLIPTFTSITKKANESAALQEATSALTVVLAEEQGMLDDDYNYYFKVEQNNTNYWFTVNSNNKMESTTAPADNKIEANTTETITNTTQDFADLSSKVTVYKIAVNQ